MDPIGQYQLGKRIAIGGMAEIYLGTAGDDAFRRPVVIKKVLPRFSNEDRFVRMLIDEAKITARLNHVNIVQILDLVRGADGEHFIVMEFVQGKDLRNVSDRAAAQSRAVPLSITLFVLAEICDALDYAHRLTDDEGHALNLIHRDVSPSNILLSSAGDVKLTDFGVARFGRDASQVGSLKGKLAYMPPEQARGDAVDHRSDIFSTGAVLYELITGSRVYRGESDVDILKKARRGDVQMPSLLAPSIHTELERILLRALAPQANDRFQSAAEFASTLRDFAFEHCDSPGSPNAVAALLAELFAAKDLQIPSFERGEKTLNTVVGFRQADTQRPAFADQNTQPGEPSTRLLAHSRRNDLDDDPDDELDTRIIGPGHRRAVDSPDEALLRVITDHPLVSESGLEQLQTPVANAKQAAAALGPLDTDDENFYSESAPTRIAPANRGQHSALTKLFSDERSITNPSVLPPTTEHSAEEGGLGRGVWFGFLAFLGAGLAIAALLVLLWPDDDAAPGPVTQKSGQRAPSAAPRSKLPALAPAPSRSDMRTVQVRVAPDSKVPTSKVPEAKAPPTRVAAPQPRRAAKPPTATPVRKRGRLIPRERTRTANPAAKRKRAPRKGRTTTVTRPPPKPTRSTVKKAPKKAQGRGALVLKSEPWAYITIDGKKTSRTTSAQAFSLSAGRHTIKLHNPTLGLSKTIKVEIAPGATLRRFISLK